MFAANYLMKGGFVEWIKADQTYVTGFENSAKFYQNFRLEVELICNCH